MDGTRLLNDLLRALGGVPPERVCTDPPPGTATEEHLLRHLHAIDRRLFELVEGTLIERAGSLIGAFLSTKVSFHVGVWSDAAGDLGAITGATGPLRTCEGHVRLPSVAFTRWDRLPGGHLPAEPIPDFAADLAVEVLSDSNTPAEIDRKLCEYFACGAKLVWVIDPDTRTTKVYTSPTDPVELTATDTLDGGDVLPGFRLPLADLFAKLPPEPVATPKPRRKKPTK